jgi:hypothetical protein
MGALWTVSDRGVETLTDGGRMNQYQGAGGGWNASPQAYNQRQQAKAQKHQDKHGVKPVRIRPSLFGRFLSAPFRFVGFVLKVTIPLALLGGVGVLIYTALNNPT